ncbi:MAG: DUF1622 domain-containing protein [Oscillospiraceae bacterium]
MVMDFLHNVLRNVTDYAIILFEFMGIIIIVWAGLCGIISYIRRDPLTRLKLAKGMAMGLEFKLGSEILRTVVVRDLSEIVIVGSIILLRAALTFLIHWEIKNEEKETALLDIAPHLIKNTDDEKTKNAEIEPEGEVHQGFQNSTIATAENDENKK